jgi:GNAT superfamily N-acetyltransferase
MAIEITVARRRADHPDSEALIAAYLRELEVRLGGFDPARSVSAEPDEMELPKGVFLVIYEGEEPVACGGVKTLSPGVGEIKRMFVRASARGHGHGRRLLAALEAEGRALGHTRFLLDTAAPLKEAEALYLAAGYTKIDAYNDNPYAASWFEKRV